MSNPPSEPPKPWNERGVFRLGWRAELRNEVAQALEMATPEQLEALDPLAIKPPLSGAPRGPLASDAKTREQRRSRRKREVRARTISVKRMTKRELELGRLLYPDDGHDRPKTRAECMGAQRPCPFVSCHHHLYLDVSPRTGAIKLNFPDLEVWELQESCALDVADRGGTTLEDVGAIMNITRERIRQVEVKAMANAQAHPAARQAFEELPEYPAGTCPTGLASAQELWAPGKIVRLPKHGPRLRKRRLPVLQPTQLVDEDFDVIEDEDEEIGG